jgi:hypothetical protein
LCTAF